MSTCKRWLLAMAALMCLMALAGCQNEAPVSSSNAPEITQAAVPTASPEAIPDATADSTPEETDAVTAYTQSPFLEGKDLPPVEERLPKVPKISNEMPSQLLTYQTGTYGGVFRTVRMSPDTDTVIFIINNEPLINTPALLGEEITPNVLEAYSVNEGNNEFTFTLREGMKWSDGVPVTMADVQFAIEDVLFNNDLTPAGVPNWLREQGKPGNDSFTFEVVDDWSFKIKFSDPYGGFLLSTAIEGWRGYTEIIKPKHYLMQFHTQYTPLADLEGLIADRGFQPGEWVNLFNDRDIVSTEVDKVQAPDMPKLTPWLQVTPGDTTYYERNPYYFKVDVEGQQLPYIDQVESSIVQNVEMINMKLLAGEADHSYEWIAMAKVSMFKESEATSGLKTMTATTLHRTAANLMFNLTNIDETWRSAAHNSDFRKAVNMALNREEVVESVFMGFAKPYANQDNFDPAAAEALLDEIGCTKSANDFRLAPNGKKIQYSIDYAIDAYFDFPPTAEIVTENLKAIGLDAFAKGIAGTLNGQRIAANEHTGGMFAVPGPVMWFRPEWSTSTWMPLWHTWWYSGGENGEEPPQEIKAFLEKVDAIRPAGYKDAHGIWDQIVANHTENNWFFQLTQEVVQPVAVRATIQNFEDHGYAIANNYAAEQWWFAE